MLVLLASLSLAAFPVDSFRVKVTAPHDLRLTVTYNVDARPPVTRQVQGSAEFNIPHGEFRLTVSSDNQVKDFHVQVRGPGNRITGTGWGSCVVQIEADRRHVNVNADEDGACKSKIAAPRAP